MLSLVLVALRHVAAYCNILARSMQLARLPRVVAGYLCPRHHLQDRSSVVSSVHVHRYRLRTLCRQHVSSSLYWLRFIRGCLCSVCVYANVMRTTRKPSANLDYIRALCATSGFTSTLV